MAMNVRARGDTLVEVIVSFAIFSVVAVSVSVLMNRGLAIGQQSLEISLVREQINAQAEMLRFARYDTTNPTIWANVTVNKLADAGKAAARPSTCEVVPSSAFVMHPTAVAGELKVAVKKVDNNTYESPQANSYVTSDGKAFGMWIQAAQAEGSTPSLPAHDFYIHACWYIPSSSKPQTLVTMVRLYG